MKRSIKMDKFDCTMTIDPNSNFNGVPEERLMAACGLIPAWLATYSCKETRASNNLKDHLDKEYTFGMFPMEGGKVNDNLSYSFPEDPDLHPLMHYKNHETEAEFIMFQHAMCAVRQTPNDEWFVTRMD